MPIPAGQSDVGAHPRSAPSACSSCAWFGENPGWGYRRVHEELTTLGIKVAPSTAWKILKQTGLDPAPERASTTWADFLRVRHGITSLFAAFNIADGSVIGELHRQHRAAEFKKFLITIDESVPAELDIHLICDDYGTHKTAAIRAWPARHPRFHMHFTPTGSSWINQVERWFGYLTDQLIRRGVHKSVQALEDDIRGVSLRMLQALGRSSRAR